MIKVFSGNLLIRDGRHRRTFNPATLSRAISDACRAAGIHGADWLAEHVATTVAEGLIRGRRDGRNEDLPSRSQIDRIVCQLLLDLGYSEAAAAYCRDRSSPEDLHQADRRPWTPERLRRLLEASLPLTPEATARLTGMTAAHLEHLGFTTASDELIRQLGMHLVHAANAGEQAAAAQGSPWLFAADHWQPLLAPEAAELIRGGVLTVRPITRLLATVRVRFDLARLGIALGGESLTELLFLPCLHQACTVLREVLNTITGELGHRNPGATLRPSFVTVTGMSHLVGHMTIPLKPSRRQEFERDILRTVETDAGEGMRPPVVVTVTGTTT